MPHLWPSELALWLCRDNLDGSLMAFKNCMDCITGLIEIERVMRKLAGVKQRPMADQCYDYYNRTNPNHAHGLYTDKGFYYIALVKSRDVVHGLICHGRLRQG